MRKVYLDSEYHYQFQRDADNRVKLVEFTTPGDETACPKMDNRGEFKPEEGRTIDYFHLGDEVEFIFHSVKTKIGENLITPDILCGDDTIHLFRKEAIKEEDGQ